MGKLCSEFPMLDTAIWGIWFSSKDTYVQEGFNSFTGKCNL